MQIIGLTGGIGSGKSTVGGMLAARGVPVVDADVLAREVVEPGTAVLQRIVERFGAAVLAPDGSLDRKRLGAIVFADSAARRDLSALTHPEIARLAAERFVALSEQGASHVVYEVPLLFENGLEAACASTILVACPEDHQIARIMARDAVSRRDAQARIAAQMPLAEKRRRATFIVENDTTLEELERRVTDIWTRVTSTRG